MSSGQREEGHGLVHHVQGEHNQSYLFYNLSGGFNPCLGLDLIDPWSSRNCPELWSRLNLDHNSGQVCSFKLSSIMFELILGSLARRITLWFFSQKSFSETRTFCHLITSESNITIYNVSWAWNGSRAELSRERGERLVCAVLRCSGDAGLGRAMRGSLQVSFSSSGPQFSACLSTTNRWVNQRRN